MHYLMEVWRPHPLLPFILASIGGKESAMNSPRRWQRVTALSFCVAGFFLTALVRGNGGLNFDARRETPSAYTFFSTDEKVGFRDVAGNVVIERRLKDVLPLLVENCSGRYRRIGQLRDFFGIPEGGDSSKHPKVISGIAAGGEIRTAGQLYQEVGDFSEGFAPVKLGDKWGFVDWTGRVATCPRFDEVKPFSQGLAAVRVGQRRGHVNWEGELKFVPPFVGPILLANGAAQARYRHD